MPRHSLGLQAKSVIASVRITPGEEKELESWSGTATKALRALIDAEKERRKQAQKAGTR